MKRNPMFANVALATASLCLALIITEFFLRSVIPLDSRRPFEFSIPHPVLGWVRKASPVSRKITISKLSWNGCGRRAKITVMVARESRIGVSSPPNVHSRMQGGISKMRTNTCK